MLKGSGSVLNQDSFRLRNAHLRPKRQKEFYEEKGITYLLPHEVKTDKEILGIVSQLGKGLDSLVEAKGFNKATLQSLVNCLTPDKKGYIRIKDFTDLKSDLEQGGFSPKQVQRYLNSNAITTNTSEGSTLYLKFERLDSGRLDRIDFVSDIEHEFLHSLTNLYQNTERKNIYKNNTLCNAQGSVFNYIFSQFEGAIGQLIKLEQTALTERNMLDWLACPSIDELGQKFGGALKGTIERQSTNGDFSMGHKARSLFSLKQWKQFYNYLKCMAKDEQLAYGSNKRYRECFNDTQKTVNAEFKPMLYAQMERFFAKERLEVFERYAPKGRPFFRARGKG